MMMTLTLSNHLAADSAYEALCRDVRDGLRGTPKSLPPKWFYDSVGSVSRSTTPLCDSNHCPSVNGAVALASIGMPTVAERTAATTQ